MPPAPALVLETLEKVRKLQRAWNTDDLPTVLRTAPALLDTATSLPTHVKEDVTRIYTDALLQEGQFEKVLQLVQGQNTKKKQQQSQSGGSATVAVHAYALYRLERYDEAQSVATQALKSAASDDQKQQQLSTDDARALRHLAAQCHYRLGNTSAACQAYEALLDNNDDDDDATASTREIATNWVASQVANATPFVNPSFDQDRIRSFLSESSSSENDRSFPYDLVYNLATHDVLAGRDHDTTDTPGLQRALQEAQKQTRDWSADDRARELAPLRVNLEWARVLWQGGTADATTAAPMKHLTASGKLVALINRALDMPQAVDGLRLLPLDTSKLTPLQGRLLMYNRAILQYRAGQWDECMETCRLVQSSLSRDATKHKHNSNTTTVVAAPNSKVEALWWEARTTVLQVRAQLAKGGKYNKTTAEQSLRGVLQTLQKQAESTVRDDAMAYLLCHLPFVVADDNDLSTPAARIALLQSLPASWQGKRAVVASLAALYQQQGDTQKAMQVVQAAGHEDALADLLLSQGRHEQAVQLLHEAADRTTDPVAQARYTRALTFWDPPEAVAYWNDGVRPSDVLDRDDADDVVDGAELETRPVPRLRSVASTTPRRAVSDSWDGKETETGATSSSNDTKKSHEAVLRRRARKREAYLAELDRRGLRHTEHPDPERWLPKYERSYNRRRRNKNAGPHKGAQGGVSDKDAAQLDVAARQAARATGDTASGTSTAHIAAVSSSGPGRKGKSGRRR